MKLSYGLKTGGDFSFFLMFIEMFTNEIAFASEVTRFNSRSVARIIVYSIALQTFVFSRKEKMYFFFRNIETFQSYDIWAEQDHACRWYATNDASMFAKTRDLFANGSAYKFRWNLLSRSRADLHSEGSVILSGRKEKEYYLHHLICMILNFLWKSCDNVSEYIFCCKSLIKWA